MKISCQIITIEIPISEWKKVEKEWKNLRFSDKPKKYYYKDNPNLDDFFSCIETVSNNQAHKIEKKINEF